MQSSSAAASRHLPIRKDWLAATQEPALEPDRPIIDPHHHLWDRPGNRYLLHDLIEDLDSGHNIRATVFLECREMYRADGPPELRSLGETQFVAGVSAMSESGKYGATRACAGIIGNVDLRASAAAPRASSNSTSSLSGGRFRGIRNGATWHSDPSLRVFTSGSGEGLYVDRSLREGFAALAPLNLTFEAWMFHSQLGDLDQPRRRLSRDQDRAEPYRRRAGGRPLCRQARGGLRRVAHSRSQKLGQFPNVYIKLGGLGMPSLMGFEMGRQDPRRRRSSSPRHGRPISKPASTPSAPTARCSRATSRSTRGCAATANLWNAFKRVAENYSNDEKNAMFHNTALKFYRLY